MQKGVDFQTLEDSLGKGQKSRNELDRNKGEKLRSKIKDKTCVP